MEIMTVQLATIIMIPEFLPDCNFCWTSFTMSDACYQIEKVVGNDVDDDFMTKVIMIIIICRK